ncbi:hypothetical protein KZY93_000665 [Vibrio vulnificus]|nr:hypothetical protein [Vibrio vulnificus]EHU9517342.1 hypothetical protein [Vibrio vulnificus]
MKPQTTTLPLDTFKQTIANVDWDYINFYLKQLVEGKVTRKSFIQRNYRHKHNHLMLVQNDVVLSIYDRTIGGTEQE